MTIKQADLTDRFYDYLEGTWRSRPEMPLNRNWRRTRPGRRIEKAKRLSDLPALADRKITLTAAEIKEKVQEVIAKI